MPTVLVTGASRGVGLALARAYAARGWRTLAACREPGRAGDLRAAVDIASVVAMDVADPASVAAAARDLAGEAIDVLINNAGVSLARGADGRPRDTLGEVEPAAWEAVLRTNVIGPLLVTRALLPRLRAGERKVVAVVSSVMGSMERNTGGGSYAYRTSKAGANMLVRSLAADLAGEGVAVVALHPGWVRTDMGGGEAPLTPEASAEGIARVLDGVGPDRSGRFLDHTGAELPW